MTTGGRKESGKREASRITKSRALVLGLLPRKEKVGSQMDGHICIGHIGFEMPVAQRQLWLYEAHSKVKVRT